MFRAIPIRLLSMFCLLMGSLTLGVGQTYTPPPPPLTTLPPCPTNKPAKEAKKKAKQDCDPTNKPAPAVSTPAPATGSAEQKFPYPGERPATPSEAFPYPGEPAKVDTPHDPAKGDPDTYTADPNVAHDPAAEKKAAATPAGKAFPYPGDPAPAAATGISQPEPASSSSSSSSDDAPNTTAPKNDATDDDDHDEKPKLTDKGSEGKRGSKTAKPQTDTERVDEDLSIAKYYGQSGNAMGAYLRAKDAVKIEPDYPEGHFVLGEAAKRLNKQDEARTEFMAYLKLAPSGERAKAAEKALESLP